MIEYLGPVVSLFKLIIDGLSKASDAIKGPRRREVQRKIIEIQLALEDIIDKAQEIVVSIDELVHCQEIKEDDVKALRRLMYGQNNRIERLLDLLHDDLSEEFMKIFTPVTRRRIVNLIDIKGGFIRELALRFRAAEDVSLSSGKLMTKSAFGNWDHKLFLEQGYSYTMRLVPRKEKAQVLIPQEIEDQKRIIKSLIRCSKELSDFLRQHIAIEDVVLRKRVTETQ